MSLLPSVIIVKRKLHIILFFFKSKYVAEKEVDEYHTRYVNKK